MIILALIGVHAKYFSLNALKSVDNPLNNTLTYKLSETCYSCDTPGGSTRGPCKVRGNLHSIARIKVEMIT